MLECCGRGLGWGRCGDPWRPWLIAAASVHRLLVCGAPGACLGFECGLCVCTLHHSRTRHAPVGLQAGGGLRWRSDLCGVIHSIAACGNALVLRLGLAAYLHAHMVLAVLSVLLLLQLLWGPTSLFVEPKWWSHCWLTSSGDPEGVGPISVGRCKGRISPALAVICMHVGVQAEQLVAHTFCPWRALRIRSVFVLHGCTQECLCVAAWVSFVRISHRIGGGSASAGRCGGEFFVVDGRCAVPLCVCVCVCVCGS
jgi:hypothetical protein